MIYLLSIPIGFLFYWLSRKYAIVIPSVEERIVKSAIYGTKGLKYYTGDKMNIEGLISKAKTHSDFRNCINAIYYFKQRYKGFIKYGICVDRDTETLILLIDQRYPVVCKKRLFIF